MRQRRGRIRLSTITFCRFRGGRRHTQARLETEVERGHSAAPAYFVCTKTSQYTSVIRDTDDCDEKRNRTAQPPTKGPYARNHHSR